MPADAVVRVHYFVPGLCHGVGRSYCLSEGEHSSLPQFPHTATVRLNYYLDDAADMNCDHLLVDNTTGAPGNIAAFVVPKALDDDIMWDPPVDFTEPPAGTWDIYTRRRPGSSRYQKLLSIPRPQSWLEVQAAMRQACAVKLQNVRDAEWNNMFMELTMMDINY